MAPHGNGGGGHGQSYSARVLNRTFWALVFVAFGIDAAFGIDNWYHYHEIPFAVGAAFWIILGATAVVRMILGIINKQ